LLPTGRLQPAPSQCEDDLSPAVRQRIAEAFARGTGHGLLQLGLMELTSALTADLAYFRELARSFLTTVCAKPDLEAERERLSVAPPADDLRRLAGAAPPMPGSEYLDAPLLQRLWGELEEALRAELHGYPGTVQAYLHSRSPVWNLVGRVCLHLAENRRDEDHPFAFLATYTSRASAKAKAQHSPLGHSLRRSGPS